MSHVHRVTRRAQFADQAPDDLHWPMDVALIVMGGFLLGVALALLRFDEPRWLLNAWTSLIFIPLLVVGSLAASRLVSRRWMRRTMQFALLASMLIHLGVLVAVRHVDMPGKPSQRVAMNEDVVRRKTRSRTRDLSSYRFARQGNRRPDFERPVETETPAPPVELMPERSDVDQSPLALQPQPVLEPQPTTQPSIVNKKRVSESIPRQSEQASRISRNLRPQLDAQPRAEPLATTAPQPTRQPNEASASRTDVSKAATAIPHERIAAADGPRSPSTPMTSRAERPREGPVTATAPALERRATDSLQPSVAAEATPRSAPFQPQLVPRLAPDNAPVERTADSPPPTFGRTEADLRDAAEIAPRAQRRENVIDTQPLAAATPLPVPSRQPRRTERSAATATDEQDRPAEPSAAAARVADVASPSRSPSSPAQDEALRPTPADVARQSVARSEPVSPRQQPRDIPATSPMLEETRNSSMRVVQSDVPTLSPQERPAARPERSLLTAPTPASPTPIESPATQVADSPARTSTTPAPTALARSTDGIAGSGYSPNLDRATPAPESPAQVASGSATRARATQLEPEGQALSPSSRSVAGRSRADAPTPGTLAGPTTEAVASQPAQSTESPLAASSSASLNEAAARADAGPVSADKGDLQVDIGPKRVVSQLQSGRGSGGGQPELNFAPQQAAAQLARSGSRQASLAVDETADTVVAPEGEGGATPLALDASPAATAARRTDAGGASTASGEPATAIAAGPAAEPNVADLAGEMRLRRAERTAADGPNAAGAGVDEPQGDPRSEPVDAVAGDPLAGGGRQSRQRLAQGPTLGEAASGVPLATFESPLASTTPSTAPAAPVAAGVALERQPGGTALPDGPFAQEVVSNAEPGAAGITDELLRPSRAAVEEVVEGSPSEDLALARQRPATGPVTASTDPLAALRPGPDAAATSDPMPATDLAARELDGVLDRLASSLPVEIDAEPGPGGLEATPAPDVGLDDRRASEDSLQIQSRITRFPRSEIGGQAALNPAPVVATEAFRQRLQRRADQPGGQPLSPETEKAIEYGLIYLARQQLEDGRWTLIVPGDERPGMNSDTAATGLALLAFQGAGYTHKQDHYARVVQGGLDLLLASQDEDGCLFIEADDESNRFARLYSHGIATLALCEAYGMTQDPALREPAQKAIDYIVATQHRELGGWRYTPNYSSDTSVSGWMMMALKSGELSGLKIPRETYTRVVRWLDRAQASDDEPFLYRYNPLAPDTEAQRHGRVPSATMTAVGLLMRLYSGWDRENPQMQAGAKYLRDNLPSLGSPADPLLSRRRDTYYWYYATQVMFHMGGEDWRQWNARLYPLLINTQIPTGAHAGSWDPLEPVPDRWAGHAGRIYVTAMNLLSLEVHYRHLPLYVETAE